MAIPSALIYDSDAPRKPVVSEVRNLWAFRGLLRLLVTRDITLRYKRSVLGAWWTLLNPVLTAFVLWVIFGQLFRFPTEVPYIVYLLSGILIGTFFSQAIIAVGSSIVNSSPILAKVYVPAEVFSISAASAAGVNFLISLIPLIVFMLLNGVAIPVTFPLVVYPGLAMLAFVAGIGLIVAASAVFFFDVIDLTTVVLTLVVYLAPTFYPLSIVPEEFVWIIKANPLYSYLEVFRHLVYRGEFAPLWNHVVMLGSAAIAFAIGAFVFSRASRRLAAML